METTAVVGTASGKGYHSDKGSLPKDKSSKKDNMLSSNDCNEVRLTFRDDEWDSFALEQRSNDKEISNIENTDSLELSFSVNQDNRESTHSQSSEFEDSIDSPFLNETYSIHYSEPKLKTLNLIHLNSELNPEMQKREEMFFSILEHPSNKTIELEGIHKISDADFKETTEDMQKYDMDEDSQQEYHSAEEQEYRSNHFSFDKAETLSIPNLDVVELRNSGYEVKCVSNLEDNHIKLESGSVTSLNSLNDFAREYSTHVSEFQSAVVLKEYHEPNEKYKEQETNLVYRTVFDDIGQRSSSLGKQEYQSKNPQKAPETKNYTEKMKSKITENKYFCGNAIVDNKVLQHLDNPSALPQDRVFETRHQACKDCQTSWTSVFDDSVISPHGYSRYKSLQSTPDPALDVSARLPRIALRGNEATEEDGSLRIVNSNATNKMCSPDRKETCPELATDAAICTVTINQAVDVSTDFRACFTTSRATSARSSVVSTSSNTEITMMNEKRPGEWQGERQSVACNTDWSYSQDYVDTQMAAAKGSEKSLSADSLKPSGSFLNKDFLELRKTYDITDLKQHPEREFQLSKDMEKNLPSKCCQKIMQRAAKAEMHLLNVHYQMCHRHCYDIYRLVKENRAVLNRNLPSNSAKKELGSALLSVLGDLKVRYMNLKEKILQGLPLEELPPLSVESKLLSTFFAFASRLMKGESLDFSGADSELDNRSAPDVDVSPSLKKTLSQISSLYDSSHPKQDTSPKENFKNDDVNIDFSQLKLDDKECRNYHEISEDWFDAKENLTGVDFSGAQENQTQHDRWNPQFPQEMKAVELLRRDKGFLMHVGGLGPSVSETDLKSHFQKYQVSEISIYGSSDYRYASLTFKDISDAKMAVKEMNGTEINGKPVSLRLIKTPVEYTSPHSSKSGDRVTLNHLEKSINKEVISTSTVSGLPKSRPRQLGQGSEQDSEFSPLDQKGIKKTCEQTESQLLPETPGPFIPPNALNLRSFTKIMKRLTELHPEVSRDHIIDALQEVRINQKGVLNGLSISTIVEMTSSVLKNSAPS